MNPSETNENPQPNKTPQIGRREIGAFLVLLTINWMLVLLVLRALSVRQRVTIPYSPIFLAQMQVGDLSTVTSQDAAIQRTLSALG